MSRGTVIYWMSRDCRVEANWGLLHADDWARAMGHHLCVAFCLAPSFGHATRRAYGFMVRGLEQTAARLAGLGIPFFLLRGAPPAVLPPFAAAVGASLAVTDFDPLRLKRLWLVQTADALPCPVHEVDSRNIVPCRFASDKREYGAYTIRPKILRHLPRFLVPPPVPAPRPAPWAGPVDGPWLVRGSLPLEGRFDADAALALVDADPGVPEVDGFAPGPGGAAERLRAFLGHGLAGYDEGSRRPDLDATSKLSPYLHFGHISSLQVALAVTGSSCWPGDGIRADREEGAWTAVPEGMPGRGGPAKKGKMPDSSAGAFLEELIVRRELADNFCLRCDRYDTPEAFPDWASATLEKHRADHREFLYSPGEFETAATHDPLWNAAQRRLADTGFVHGYLRMYWAKKILQWSPDPETAVATAVRLNDRYGLDGRDSNGYAGIAWSIGGVHDRAWPERPVFGKIRYMSPEGCARKFKVPEYIKMAGVSK